MAEQFQHLFTPIKVGPMTVRNRIVMRPHGRLGTPDEAPSETAIDYYATRARGGVGLMVISGCRVGPQSSFAPPPAINRDSHVGAFRRLADAIHEHDAKVIYNLEHDGRYAGRLRYGGAAWAPSPLRSRLLLPAWTDEPHEMDTDEIKQVVEFFGSAARIIQQAGWDGVEIAATNWRLMAEFMSPACNLRCDEYGGSLENRLRFPLEVIDSIRAAVGQDFVVGIKIDGDELVDGGLTLDDMKVITPILVRAGLDYINVTAGALTMPSIPSMYFPLGCYVYLAAEIRKVVDVPVIAVGRINDPVLAEKILADGQADMVGMCRALICDPELPNKARQGRLDEIRRCIGCLDGCRYTYYGPHFPLRCALNSEVGMEKEFAIVPAANKKKVMVIGGGAAGLEVARVAALRGHRVTLYEKENELGGQLNIAARAPGRQDFSEVPRYYTYQMKLLGVDVHLGTQATVETVKKENPDVVVVATGSLPVIPPIPGADHSNVNVVEAREVLQAGVEVGQKVVLIDDEYHMQGLTTAEFLADRGKKVELLTDILYAGAQAESNTLEAVYNRVLNKGVIITPLTRVKGIKDKAIVTYNVINKAERRIEDVDTVVVAVRGKADDSLFRLLKGQMKEVYAVGQCLSPRRLRECIFDGAYIARLL